jgi:6-phosphogluconolactonase
MNMEVRDSVDSAAETAAKIIADGAARAIAARGRFVLAVSGGHTPWLMLRALAAEKVDWSAVHIVQVDERVAIAGHPDRNLTHLHTSFLDHVPVKPQLHAMPVESEDLEKAAAEYEETLRQIAGTPPVLDMVTLGLGFDGHTASLVPGDPVLKVTDRDVAVTGYYQERMRMTLTYPILNRTREILWVITGEEKAGILRRFLEGDASIPAAEIRRLRAIVVADQAAAGQRKAA